MKIQAQCSHFIGDIVSFPADSSSIIRAAISFDAAPAEVLIAGGALVASTAGYLIFEAIKAAKQMQQPTEAVQAAEPKAVPLPREDAVLVFGASGRTGRQVVAEVCSRI